MAGVFGKWQPAYAEAGIATFPVDGPGKKPLVGNYMKAGHRGSAEWARKFPDADAFGFVCGKRNGLAVLDVDTTDERVLADAQGKFGPTPVIVQTASGKFHGWYRHRGVERRQIRTAMPGQPVDVLATGFAIAPPSLGASGEYRFIQGSLADLANLPHMATASNDAMPVSLSDVSSLVQGSRNVQIFPAVMKAAHKCTSERALLDFAVALNKTSDPPLPSEELARLVAGVWGYTTKGKNFAGIGRSMVFGHDQFDSFAAEGKIGQDAWFLRGDLARVHYASAAFYCANAMKDRLGWSRPRLQDARECLINLGEIVEVRQYSQKLGPAVYRWPATSIQDARVELSGLDRGRQGGGV